MDYGILDNNATMGERVRYFRKKRNLSQLQLAQRLSISRGVLSRLENKNQHPSFEVMAAIVDYLDIPLIYVFKGSRYRALLYNCYVGKTTIFPDGNFKNFGAVQVVSDYYFNTELYFCITDGNRYYLASFDTSEGDDCSVCSRDEDNICFIAKKTENGFADEKSGAVYKAPRVVAHVVADITDMTIPIIM